jgi:capsular exopolysaccharide synthesis family protein
MGKRIIITMLNDDRPLLNDGTTSPSVALLPVGATERRSGDWSNASALMQPAGGQAAPDLMAYVHAVRRYWLMALGIGLLCAAVAGPAVWFGLGATYTASALLSVGMSEKPIAFQLEPGGADKDRYDIYKATQSQLVTSRFVLMAALRNPLVAKLPIIRREQEKRDPIVWLQKHIAVGFPGKAELMEVSMSRGDPEEAALLVREVVEAYLHEVVNTELDKKRLRLSELDKACSEKEQDIRSRREELKKLATELGTSTTENLTLKQKLSLEELALYRGELAKVQSEARRFKAELAAQQAVLKSIENVGTTDAEVEAMVQTDPVGRELFVELGWKKLDQLYMDTAVVKGASSLYVDRYQQALKTLQESYNARKAELVESVRQKRRAIIQSEVRKLESSVSVLTEQEHTLQVQLDAKHQEATKFGNSTVDMEMLLADIRNADYVLNQLASERDKLRVESRSAPRIALLMGASKPEMPSNTAGRIALTFLAMLAGMCVPAGVIAIWDAGAKRINTCADVTKGLRLSVLGSVPLIPANVIRRLGSPSKRCQSWQMRLTESVDGIAARVLRKAEVEQCRVIMVTSAAGGEGKTTLATQLALSLARAGRRTVLVDFDLRRPAFDEVFGLPLEPGVCEALRQESDISTLVHEVATKNLAVMTAGRWDRNALASLSNGSVAGIFKKLREDYDFVVIDASPVLPVADARFISQHVDAVLLSIFRDVSKAPKIQAACEILAAFGMHAVEAVVTGPTDNLYGEDTRYESTVSA